MLRHLGVARGTPDLLGPRGEEDVLNAGVLGPKRFGLLREQLPAVAIRTRESPPLQSIIGNLLNAASGRIR